ncbi:MAG: SulP family inorganic anion transporter [Acidimicrobiales bacterium]
MSSWTQYLRNSLAKTVPRKSDYAGLRRSWRGDLLAGITVGVVALPLALGFGIASGVGATAGIFTAIVAGIIAAVFGGSSVQVSGPTGAMAVILLPIVAHDGVGAVQSVAIIAGVLVLVMGVLGLGRMIQFVPWSVLEGFTVGIAITIGLQQVPLLLGQRGPTGTSVVDSAWRAVKSASFSTSTDTLLLGVLVVVVMVLWPRVNHRVPSSIVAVIIATLVASLSHLSIPTIASLPSHLPAPKIPSLGVDTIKKLFGPAIAVATLAAIESLLSARVADGMTGARSSDRREMTGQGLANIACGLFGGMPATGAIARTAVNVRSGAQTRVAAITHSVSIIMVILLAAPLVTKIPLCVLGAVLVVTAVKMINHAKVRRVLRAHLAEALTFALTALVTVAVNLVTAIEVGLAVAAVLALRAVASGSGATQEGLSEYHDGPIDETELLAEHIAIVRLDGALFFGATSKFEDTIYKVKSVAVIIFRLKGLTLIDSSGAEAFARIVDSLEAEGTVVLLKGARAEHSAILSAAGVFSELEERGHVFDDLPAAIAHARHHVEELGYIS